MLKKPGRQRRRRKTRITSRYAKEEDFLPARKDSLPEDARKKFAQPRATCKDKVAGNDSLPRACRNGIQESRSKRRRDLRKPVFSAPLHSVFDNRRHGAPRHQYAAFRLENTESHVIEGNLRKAPFERTAIHLFEGNLAAFEGKDRLPQLQVIFSGKPQDSRLLKQHAVLRAEKFLPLRERAHCPSRIQLVRAITHSDDAGFAPGAGPRVCRPIGVYQADALSAPRQ